MGSERNSRKMRRGQDKRKWRGPGVLLGERAEALIFGAGTVTHNRAQLPTFIGSPLRPRRMSGGQPFFSTVPALSHAPDQSDEETMVFAIYSARRDAEVAKEHLQDQDIETSVRADGAGGMHPQLWRPHGVKLAGSRVQPVE